MGLRPLDFKFLDPIKDKLIDLSDTVVIFVRPFGGKLHRVYSLPNERREEIKSILHSVCTCYHKDVWYFRIPDEATRLWVAAPLVDVDIEHVFAEADQQANN